MDILNQFMKQRSYLNVMLVTKLFLEKIREISILNQFMKERSHSSAMFVIPLFLKTEN